MGPWSYRREREGLRERESAREALMEPCFYHTERRRERENVDGDEGVKR